MPNARVTRPDFYIERVGDAFVYQGKRRIELGLDGTTMTLVHVRFEGEPSGRVSEIADAVWELAEPGVLDLVEISYRAGDPYETVTVHSRT